MGEPDRDNVLAGPEFELPEVTASPGAFYYRILTEKSVNPLLVNANTGESVSSGDVLRRGISVAVELRERGVGPGDVVCTLLENSFEFSYVLLGTMFVGASLAPVNTGLIASDIKHLLSFLEPKIIFSLPRLSVMLQNIIPEKTEIVEMKKNVNWDNFLSHRPNNFAPTPVENLDEPAFILCTSGTSGPPKGVRMTRKIAITLSEIMRSFYEDTGAIFLMVSPIFWASGLLFTLQTISSCTTLIFLTSWDVDLYLRTIEKYSVTSTFLSPPYIVAIAKNPSADKYDVSSLAMISCGGAGLSLAIKEKVENLLNVRIFSGYGITEALYPLFMPGAMSLEKPTSIGTVGPACFAKIIDTETGKALGPNKEGELVVKSPIPFGGYYRNPEAAKGLVDKEGWLHTGDIGHYDEDGYFYVYDRIKELIKYKGTHISPSDIESVLISHPGVKDAAVVGMHHDDDQERAVGFVVKTPGFGVTEGELSQLIKEKLPEYKWLHGGIHFIAEIPRTASGKIIRRKLRQRATEFSKL